MSLVIISLSGGLKKNVDFRLDRLSILHVLNFKVVQHHAGLIL